MNPVFKSLNTSALKSTIGSISPIKGPSYASMTCLEIFRFISNYVNRFLPKIMSYLPLADSSTWHFHVTTLVTISAGKISSTSTLWLIVMFPVYVFHCITAYVSGHSFWTSLLMSIVELHPLSHRIRNFLNFTLPFLVFINLCIIGE